MQKTRLSIHMVQDIGQLFGRKLQTFPNIFAGIHQPLHLRLGGKCETSPVGVLQENHVIPRVDRKIRLMLRQRIDAGLF